MTVPDPILRYLTETYQPYAVIAYGSFADGSANENSDFDALVIADHAKKHDSSVIGGIVLDVFVFPPETFLTDYDPLEFIQVSDGRILMDQTGVAEQLQKRVLDYIEHAPKKTEDELRQELAWCEKMLSRTCRGDAEGFYRWHWLLCDSLEIYCDMKGRYYPGPKKALRQMAQADPEAFNTYSRALKSPDREALSEWVSCLKKLFLFTDPREDGKSMK